MSIRLFISSEVICDECGYSYVIEETSRTPEELVTGIPKDETMSDKAHSTIEAHCFVEDGENRHLCETCDEETNG